MRRLGRRDATAADQDPLYDNRHRWTHSGAPVAQIESGSGNLG
jgi:hypothetical protein